METLQITGLWWSSHSEQFHSSIMSLTSPVQLRCEIFFKERKNLKKITEVSLKCRSKIYFLFYSLGFLLRSLWYWFLEVCVNIKSVIGIMRATGQFNFQETEQSADSSKHKLNHTVSKSVLKIWALFFMLESLLTHDLGVTPSLLCL